MGYNGVKTEKKKSRQTLCDAYAHSRYRKHGWVYAAVT